MRRLPVLLMLLAAAAPAAAAPRSKKPPRGVYLRYDPGPAAGPVRPAPTTPAPAERLALGGLRGLSGLPGGVDAPAQCRARCARERYACDAGGDDCSGYWAACLRPCGAGAPR